MSAPTSHSLKKMHTLAENLKIGMDDGTGPSDLSKRADAISSGRIPYRELQQLYEELTDKLKKVSNEKDELAHLASQRQEAFLRTEQRYQEDLRLLEVRLQKMGLEDKSRMEPLRQLHGNIQDTINSIQNKTARVLQDQERDLIRAFRARLADVTVELENERKKNESGSAEWVARCRKLTEELEWLRDLTDKLTSENKSVLKDNRRFKRQMKTQEEDREFLIKQLVSVKKENARLRYSFDQLMAGNVNPIGLNPDQQQQGLLPPGQGNISAITGQPMSQSKAQLRAGTPITDSYGNRSTPATPFGGRSAAPSRPQSAMVQPSRASAAATQQQPMSRPGTAQPGSIQNGEWLEKEQRYKALVGKLQRQVEDGVRSYRTLRTQYTAELAGRTELQTFVKKCIDDVRADMAERGRSATLRRAQGQHRVTSAGASRAKQPLPPPVDPRSIPLSEFTPADRISVMEWLMAQDSVIFMLYEKIFPQRNTAAAAAAAQGNNTSANSLNNTQSDVTGGLDFGKLSGTGPFTVQHSAGGGNQPGHLFTATSPAPRPSSSPIHLGSQHQQQQRPQTSQPSRSTNGPSTGSFAQKGSTTGNTGAITGEKPTQYERPLGSRPLSGFTAPTSDSVSRARPHTAAPTASNTRGEIANNEQIQAEVEAELRAARDQRGESSHEEDEYQAESVDHGNLSDEDDDDRELYEEKEARQDED